MGDFFPLNWNWGEKSRKYEMLEKHELLEKYEMLEKYEK